MSRSIVGLAFLLSLGAALASPPVIEAQAQVGRQATEALVFPELDFRPPEPDEHDVEGVSVLTLEDHTLPLVTIYVRFTGGYARFGRELYAAGTALPSLLRFGGTAQLTPDSVDKALEYYAFQTSFGTGGGSISINLNTLVEHLPSGLDLLAAMLTEPAFDPMEVEVWRGRQVESVARRGDDPGRLAFSEFNHLLYGDHPIGWEMDLADLDPANLSLERFREVHGRVVCRDNLILGLTGDLVWADIESLVDSFVKRVPPCAEPLPPSPIPTIRDEPGVYLIEKDLEQSVIVMAHATDLRLAAEPSYYAATIGNSILGGGGFSSRILARVRTEEGFAYSASSLWTIPREYDGLLGAITRTRPENTVPAVEVILRTMEELRVGAPDPGEIRTAVDRIVNGFVFNFDTPGQIVSRTMFYLAQDLPTDWLERYVEGVQSVTPASVLEAFSRHLRPDEMMILIVGDPDRIGREALSSLGPLTVLEIPVGR